VVDDGSTDETEAVVRQLQRVYLLQYHQQPNAGKAAATRRGIALSTGDIIFTLDADDWFLPGKMAETLRIFDQNPQVTHVASPALIHWQDGSRPDKAEPVPTWMQGKPIPGEKLLQYFFDRNMLFGGGSTFACRASVLKRLPLPDAVDMYTDEWLVMHALLAGDSYFLPQPYSVWRVHGGNYSGAGGQALRAKHARLEHASSAILQALEAGNYPAWLQHAYRLKHETRRQGWMERQGSKPTAERLRYLKDVVLSGQYSMRQLWSYRSFNRLIR